ncbi:MAG: alpha/beta fold hydrolase [Pseudooceanicola sp.]
MIYCFADCRLDTDRHALSVGGAEVHVEPQVFALLRRLCEAGGNLVTRDDLIASVWDGRIVSEATISARINAARAAVGDDGQRQGVIRTVTRRGLQMAVPVEVAGAAPAARPGGSQVVRMTRASDGTGIAWAKSGSGPPFLRAGHWLSHLERDWQSPIWRPFIDRFNETHTLYRYDPRGTGLSDRDCGALTLDAFVDDLRAVADAAGLDRFALYGTSQSVPIAIAFAARFPDRVSALTLHAGFIQGSAIRDRRDGTALTETFINLIRSGWGQPGSAFMQAFSSLFLPTGTPAQMQDLVEMQVNSATPEFAADLRAAIGEFDVADLLDQVRCPVLVSHARGDAVQPFEESRKLAQRLPDARFLALDSACHILVPEDPAWDQVTSAVRDFLAEAGA